jgi:hypothetical protein
LATNLISQSVNIELDEAAALRLQKETVLTVLPGAGQEPGAVAEPGAKKSAVKRPVKQKVKLVLTQEEPEKL